MIYQIRYFGLLADRRGTSAESIESTATTPAEIYQSLDTQYSLGLSPDHLRTAVNDEFVPWNHPLQNGDHIAFLPPMSGG